MSRTWLELTPEGTPLTEGDDIGEDLSNQEEREDNE